MSRIRFVFEKRGFSCFVRHVELPQLFGRIARRSGLRVELTQGMSPHPHIVMGPALPVGVISLYELAEIWFAGPVNPGETVTRLNAQSPAGFRFLKAAPVPPDTMSLNKCFDAASYWFCLRDPSRNAAAAEALLAALPDTILSLKQEDGEMEIVMHDPSKTGPGALVKTLVSAGIISGWPDACIARLAIGRWKAQSGAVTPLL